MANAQKDVTENFAFITSNKIILDALDLVSDTMSKEGIILTLVNLSVLSLKYAVLLTSQ